MKYKDFNNIIIDNSANVCSVGRDTLLLAKASAELKPKKALDLGTGTGFIAIYLSSIGVECTASDICSDSVALASKNAKKNKVSIKCIQSDLFENIKGVFDLITFNTPLVQINPSLTLFTRYIRKFFPKGVPIIPTITFLLYSNKRKKLLENFLESAKKHSKTYTKFLLIIHKLELKLFSKYKPKVFGEHGDFLIIRFTIQ